MATEPDSSRQQEQIVINADHIITMPVGRRTYGTQRALIADWMRLRTLDPEISNIDVAKQLGVSKQYLYSVIKQATREGWLRFDDPIARIEHQLIPKTIDNLNQFLDERDKTVTIEVAKGTLFKHYQESQGLNQTTQTVLALKIEMPDGTNDIKIVEGQVVGRPKVLMETNET